MGPPKFKDLLKAPSDLLGDDFTDKKTLKFKMAAAGVTFTAEDELKLKGNALSSVAGKVAGKYAHKPSGVNIDKLECKGADSKLELSYPVFGGKTKFKGDLKGESGDVGGSVEFEKGFAGSMNMVAALTSKYKLDVSLTTGSKAFALGGAFSFQADTNKIKGFDAGASYTTGPLFLGLTSADKFAAATCGLTYKATPLLTLVAKGTFPKNVLVGGAMLKMSDTLTIKAKTDGKDLEAVALNKVAQGLKIDLGLKVPITKPEEFKLGFLVNLG